MNVSRVAPLTVSRVPSVSHPSGFDPNTSSSYTEPT